VTLALLHTLRDIGIGLCIAVTVALALRWEARSERKHAELVEQEDLEDFTREWPIAQTRDWEWPTRPDAARSEYVAKPKERAR
jgi:hypothetical protein